MASPSASPIHYVSHKEMLDFIEWSVLIDARALHLLVSWKTSHMQNIQKIDWKSSRSDLGWNFPHLVMEISSWKRHPKRCEVTPWSGDGILQRKHHAFSHHGFSEYSDEISITKTSPLPEGSRTWFGDVFCFSSDEIFRHWIKFSYQSEIEHFVSAFLSLMIWI